MDDSKDKNHVPPVKNDVVAGAENSLYAELAGEGPGGVEQVDGIEGEQRARATIRSNPLGPKEGMPLNSRD